VVLQHLKDLFTQFVTAELLGALISCPGKIQAEVIDELVLKPLDVPLVAAHFLACKFVQQVERIPPT